MFVCKLCIGPDFLSNSLPKSSFVYILRIVVTQLTRTDYTVSIEEISNLYS